MTSPVTQAQRAEAHDAARRTIRSVHGRLGNMLQDVLGTAADLDELAAWLRGAADQLRIAERPTLLDISRNENRHPRDEDGKYIRRP